MVSGRPVRSTVKPSGSTTSATATEDYPALPSNVTNNEKQKSAPIAFAPVPSRATVPGVTAEQKVPSRATFPARAAFPAFGDETQKTAQAAPVPVHIGGSRADASDNDDKPTPESAVATKKPSCNPQNTFTIKIDYDGEDPTIAAVAAEAIANAVRAFLSTQGIDAQNAMAIGARTKSMIK